ncbi:hypothetical protein FE257_006057 [Aspergillus nanangensis]|uniref:Large ribosomal subunit protein uL22 n=1 Tax=Aspergillus nanangensis TaxID=2582783 RepID=A0AAD4CPL2_ASPNN|nr:hypothetical protein FE257_006057 [Aspergillus nanangensis]
MSSPSRGPTTPGLELRERASDPIRTDDDYPEGGYGWICVICIFLINAHTWGINSAYGVFLSFYLSHDEFPNTPALVYAFVGGLSISCALLTAPIVTSLSQLLSTRRVVLLGVLLETASLISASFVTHSWQLFLSQGICFGLGMGCLFISTVGIPNQWFKKRRSVSNGIVAAGSGTGGLIYSLATNSMIQQLGFRWALRILGILSFVVNLVCGMLLRERRVSSKPRVPFKPALLKRAPFLLFLAWGFFSILGYVSLLFSLASFAQAVGLGSNDGSLASALLNLGQAIGRPLVGILSDRFGRVKVAGLASALCGILCMVFWTFVSDAASLFAFAILVGLEAGTLWASVAAVAADLVGMDDIDGALGIFWVVLVAPGTVSEVVALQLRDPGSIQGPYFPVQMFTGAMYLVAAGSLGIILMLERKQARGKLDGRSHTHTIILLHGRGSDGVEFADELFSSTTSKLQDLPACLPNWRWVFPTSRVRRDTRFQEDMTAWFDAYSLTDTQERQELQIDGLKESVLHILTILEDEVRLLGGKTDRVYLGGMSQGMATALWTVFFCAAGHGIMEPLGGFLGFCGWLPFAERMEDMERIRELGRSGVACRLREIVSEVFQAEGRSEREDADNVLLTPVLLSHGEDDAWVPVQQGRQAREVLVRQLGMTVEWDEFRGADNDGHWLKEPEAFDRIIRFVEDFVLPGGDSIQASVRARLGRADAKREKSTRRDHPPLGNHFKMVRYAAQDISNTKSARARGSYLRVSFKNTRETAQAINGMKLQRALTFLDNVTNKAEAVPFRRFAGSTGRCAQGKQFGVSKARWPEKSAKFLIDLLKNAEANADTKGLDTGNLVVKHIQVNQAPKGRRRTYRAHGRINPYMTNPCHIELILTEAEEVVPKAAVKRNEHLSSRQRGAQIRQALIEA